MQAVVAADALTEAADLAADEPGGDVVTIRPVELDDPSLVDRDGEAARVRTIERVGRVDGGATPAWLVAFRHGHQSNIDGRVSCDVRAALMSARWCALADVILMLVFQRRLVSGWTAGAVKGWS